MIEVRELGVYGIIQSIHGMRNSWNSWDKMDSILMPRGDVLVGENDKKLMKKLVKAGSDERKFLRFITVYLEINAPLYWWKQFDQYKVGTTSLSTSTMHNIQSKPFSINDFSTDHIIGDLNEELFACLVESFEKTRRAYVETKNKKYWWQIIQLLPSNFNQKRMVCLNYEVLRNIYRARKNHKLDEWKQFCDFLENMPESYLITERDE